jgi:hypothetical protein
MMPKSRYLYISSGDKTCSKAKRMVCQVVVGCDFFRLVFFKNLPVLINFDNIILGMRREFPERI